LYDLVKNKIFFRGVVKEAVLFVELLETLMKPKENLTARQFKPPYDLKMLLNLAVINLYPPFTTDQAHMFLSFLVPSITDQKESKHLNQSRIKINRITINNCVLKDFIYQKS
jgi:hypothetical protein